MRWDPDVVRNGVLLRAVIDAQLLRLQPRHISRDDLLRAGGMARSGARVLVLAGPLLSLDRRVLVQPCRFRGRSAHQGVQRGLALLRRRRRLPMRKREMRAVAARGRILLDGGGPLSAGPGGTTQLFALTDGASRSRR